MIMTVAIDGGIRLKDISNMTNVEDMEIWEICDAWYNHLNLSIDDIKSKKIFSTKRNTVVLVIYIKKKLRYLIAQYKGHNFFCKSCGFLTIPGEVVFVDKSDRNTSFCFNCIKKVRKIR